MILNKLKSDNKVRKSRRKVKVIGIVLMICILLATSILTGCKKKIYLTTGLSDTEVFKLAKETCKLPEVKLVLWSEWCSYETTFGEDVLKDHIGTTTVAGKIKEEVKKTLQDIYGRKAFAVSKKVVLTNSEKDMLQNAANEFFKTLSDKEKEYLGVTVDDVYNLYSKMYMGEKVYKNVTEGIYKEISDSEARVIKVQSIFFKTADVNDKYELVEYSEAEKLAIKQNAEKVLESAKAGNDFATLAKAHTQDLNVEFEFGKGVMVTEYEQAAFALKTGEISDIVVTPKGYYIIKCVDDYLEAKTIENKATILEKYREDEFMKSYKPYLTTLSFEFNDELWESLVYTAKEDISIDKLYVIYNQKVK